MGGEVSCGLPKFFGEKLDDLVGYRPTVSAKPTITHIVFCSFYVILEIKTKTESTKKNWLDF